MTESPTSKTGGGGGHMGYCASLRHPLLRRLYAASLLGALSRTAAIMVAKSLNAAFAQSITPETACEEEPAGDWRAFGLQIGYGLAAASVVLRMWFVAAHRAGSPFWDTYKFMAGEILGWAFKEVMAIGTSAIAAELGYRGEEEGGEEAEGGENGGGGGGGGGGSDEKEGGGDDGRRRFLRDYHQGDAPLSETREDWLHVAAYAIYAGVLFVASVAVFVLAMPSLERAVGAYFRFNYKIPFPLGLRRWGRPEDPNDGEGGGGGEGGGASEEGESAAKGKRGAGPPPGPALHGGVAPLTDEETDSIAREFATESLCISQAYVLNGAISGMIFVGIRESGGGVDDGIPLAVGVLEVYALTLMFLGGLIFRECCLGFHPRTERLADFFRDVWANLTGFALGSIATSPSGLLSGLEGLGVDETLADFLRAAVVSAVAVLFLLWGCRLRLARQFCCLRVRGEVADATAYFVSTASALAFAWAWEDFTSDVVCRVFPRVGLTGVSAVWIHTAILAAAYVPTAMVVGRRARALAESAEEELGVLHTSMHGDGLDDADVFVDEGAGAAAAAEKGERGAGAPGE